MTTEFEIWKGKDLSSLFRDIYQNQRATQSQITILIDSLRPLIKNSGDAAVIVPLIRDYLDVSVKNDSHLVRLSSIVQRLYAAERLATGMDGGGLLTEEEKQSLLQSAEEELRQIRGQSEQTVEKLGKASEAIAELTAGNKDDAEDTPSGETNGV